MKFFFRDLWDRAAGTVFKVCAADPVDKASIDSTKDCAYLHGYESALALVSNIGIKANGDDLGKMYAKLGKSGT